ncbi:aminotransferase class IV [Lacisediminihabitans changchengi]|uniref:Aminotransferase class IV n=1 Tax=Lacisediminihabitans changchengi TaxID=2787634 RepID=A0A934SR10_9MICO|nr:aminotransferase class IV [Lacisediminihabitans changchengi]MBK4346574.1 aminotransferase class IV [Lacisediminihabitans changchengi]
MSETSIHRWHEGVLQPLDYCDMSRTLVAAADSWLVTEGTALALDLHRQRFLDAVEVFAETHRLATDPRAEAPRFWDAAIDLIPREGDWFPRVELQSRSDGTLFVLRLRSAPERTRSVVLATFDGPDPRRSPTIKGPDTDALLAARTSVQPRGAGEAVILSADGDGSGAKGNGGAGYVVEGAYSALLWWRGDALCSPSPELERVDSVTARSVIALATALGIDVLYESVAPADLDGLEIWALSALHGIRIVTSWVDGPLVAEQPGRLATWRARLDRLRRALPERIAPDQIAPGRIAMDQIGAESLPV